jgi:hypothetical protein
VDDASKVSDRGDLFWSLTPISPLWDTEEPENVPFKASTPSFVFAHVRPGRYQLTLSQVIGIVLSGHCFSRRVDVSQELTVAGDMHDVRAELRPAAAVRGAVDEIHSVLDYHWPRSNNQTYSIAMTRSNRDCIYGKVGPEGTFTFADLEPGDYHIDVQLPVGGRYTSDVELNGASVADDLVHMNAGENDLRIVERFDSGTMNALIDAKKVDGSPARDENNNWFGGLEHIILFDEHGRLLKSSFGSVQGLLKGAVIPPGHYVAVAGTNAQLSGAFRLFDPRWSNQSFLHALAELGVPFEIKPGQTTNLDLPDRTIEIQNLTAKLGISMFSR